jgi:hypothetical protein
MGKMWLREKRLHPLLALFRVQIRRANAALTRYLRCEGKMLHPRGTSVVRVDRAHDQYDVTPYKVGGTEGTIFLTETKFPHIIKERNATRGYRL